MWRRLVHTKFCVDVVIDTKIVEITTKREKHPPLKIVIMSKAKKLKSGMGKLSNISREGMKFPIYRDVQFKCKDHLRIKKINQLHNYSQHIQQSLDLSTSTQNQILEVQHMLWNQDLKHITRVNPLTNSPCVPYPTACPNVGPTTCTHWLPLSHDILGLKSCIANVTIVILGYINTRNFGRQETRRVMEVLYHHMPY